MTTSDASSSRTVDVTVDSENYMQIRPEDVGMYSRVNPDQTLLTPYPRRFAHKNDTTGEVTPGSMSTLSITTGDIVRIMAKIEKLVMGSPEGVNHRLNELFLDEKKQARRSITPGTLRIFANNMACYYTGRSWRKIRLTRGEN
jgi:hypothetical protein